MGKQHVGYARLRAGVDTILEDRRKRREERDKEKVRQQTAVLRIRVFRCLTPGSVIRCFFLPLDPAAVSVAFLTLGSGISFLRILDHRFRIPDPQLIFLRA
jgi:hypothetical protein